VAASDDDSVVLARWIWGHSLVRRDCVRRRDSK
jgi:hypothetical protein